VKTRILVLMLVAGMLPAGCGPAKPVFEISGSPSPLLYGCGASVFTFKVTGPAEGLKINSIIVAYQLFDGGGKKVREATLYLYPIPYDPPVSYDASRIIVVPDSGGSAPAPDEPILDFGEGRIDFAATVYAKLLSPSPSGPDETFYFTDTKSIPVLPCAPGSPTLAPTPAPTLAPTPIELPTKKPKAPRPPCSLEPNNPNCVP
jgi:hypothetical protein